MTNQMIILIESVQLMEQGIISGSGVFGTYTDRDGTEKRIELPEQIHTFAAWKQAGYIVKKGEHAIAAFPVWTYRAPRQDRENATESDGNESNEQATGRMFMKKAFFFKRSQVEKLQPAT